MCEGDSQRMVLDASREVWNSARILEDLAWYPNEQIVRFIVKYLKRKTGLNTWEVVRPAHAVLDLGCGTGRHVKLFAEQGFEVHGFDLSLTSIQFAQEWIRSLSQSAHWVVGSGDRLPYRSHRFDVVVSHGTLDHMTWEQATRAAQEIRRVLSPRGLFYLDLISKQDSGFGRGEPAGPDTSIVPDGIETGAVQRFYNEGDIQRLLGEAFILEEMIFQEWHPVLGRGFSNLDKRGAGPLKLARYHIVAVPRSLEEAAG